MPGCSWRKGTSIVENRNRRKSDKLFGQIAVALGIVKPEQVEDAVKFQAAQVKADPVGVILMDRGLISRDDLKRILEAQQKIADQALDRVKSIREGNLFGKVAVTLRFCTVEQVDDILRVQKQLASQGTMEIGTLLVRRGILSPEQVRRVLEIQQGLGVCCPTCRTLYNTVMFVPGVTIPCYRCGATLTVPDPIKRK